MENKIKIISKKPLAEVQAELKAEKQKNEKFEEMFNAIQESIFELSSMVLKDEDD